MKSVSAEIQFPPPADVDLCSFKISHRATAPEKMRTNVKVAASIRVSRSAARQRSELLANAIIASSVRITTRGFMIRRQLSLGIEFRFGARNFFVSALGTDIVTETTDTFLRNN